MEFFPRTNHLTISGRFESLSCSLERLRASMKMPNLGRIYSPGRGHVISNGETTSTTKKGLVLLSILSYLHGQIV